MPTTPSKLGAIVLAAGGSTRMGQPKPLLEIGGQPLVTRAVDALLMTRAWPVVVVVGEAESAIAKTLARRPVLVVPNPLWKGGMATSIHAGIGALQRFSRGIDAAVIALCDQPGFDGGSAQALIEGFERSATRIAAARYSGRLGAPAIFGKEHFPALASLKGDQGARGLFNTETTAVDLPALAVDLDSPEDVRAYLSP